MTYQRVETVGELREVLAGLPEGTPLAGYADRVGDAEQVVIETGVRCEIQLLGLNVAGAFAELDEW